MGGFEFLKVDLIRGFFLKGGLFKTSITVWISRVLREGDFKQGVFKQGDYSKSKLKIVHTIGVNRVFKPYFEQKNDKKKLGLRNLFEQRGDFIFVKLINTVFPLF